MKELRGKAVSDDIKERALRGLSDFGKKTGRRPVLSIIRVGDNEADLTYERSAVKKLRDFGMDAKSESFPEDISEEELIRAAKRINNDGSVDGILVLRPLPSYINEERLKAAISPEKDVDGMTAGSQAMVFTGRGEGFAPCTPKAVIRMLEFYGIPLKGKHAVIVGRSAVAGRPLSMMLLERDVTVTVCHSRTPESLLKKSLKAADIIFLAVGKAGFLKKEDISEGAVVIDIGINTSPAGGVTGDADYEDIKDKCSMITPVPGGVGAATTAVLCENLLEAAFRNARL